jgi:subtilisin family serine protease
MIRRWESDGRHGRLPDELLVLQMPSALHRVAALAVAIAALCAAPAAAAVRSDPELPDQWALRGDAPMGAASAWARATAGAVTVAVVDTGVDLSHPDLAPNLWTNPGEVPGNGIDDDADGYVDDVHGVDLLNGDGDPGDDNGHGTHVAGIVAARGENGIGVAGVAWRARIMAVKVLDSHAAGDMSAVARGVRYAVAHGARIVNVSLSGPIAGTDIADAIDEARVAGVVIVAAAGNTGADLDVTPAYPAALAAPNLVAVTSSDRRGALTRRASFGRASVDLAAPGQDILSTARGGGYEFRSGSSTAAAQVSGALALLAGARPGLGGEALRAVLLGAARRSSLPLSAGALDIGAALRRIGARARSRSSARAARATDGRAQ